MSTKVDLVRAAVPTKGNSLVPELLVSDLARSLHFYCEVIGFALNYERPEDHFAYLSFFGSEIMLEQDTAEESAWRVGSLDYPRGRGLNLSIDCPDAQTLARRISEAGVPLQKPLEDCWYREGQMLHGQRNILVLDPDGYLLRFAQPLGTRPIDPTSES